MNIFKRFYNFLDNHFDDESICKFFIKSDPLLERKSPLALSVEEKTQATGEKRLESVYPNREIQEKLMRHLFNR